MSHPKVKGHVRLIDDAVVPAFVDQYELPVKTHIPHKWAMIDMESGNIFMLDPTKPPDILTFKKITKQDRQRLRTIVH